MNDYERDVYVDVNNIAEEWEKHPLICDNYNKLYSEALENLQLAQGEYELAKSKHDIERCKAFISDDIRRCPARYGFTKVTDKIVDSIVISHNDYNKEVEKYNERRKKANEKLAEAMRIESRLKRASSEVTWHRKETFAKFSDDVLRVHFFNNVKKKDKRKNG